MIMERVQAPPPTLKTPRLTLRAPEVGDAHALAALGNDAAVARMSTGLPYPYTEDHALAFIAMAEAADPKRDLPLIMDHYVYGPVGVVGLHRRAGPFAEIGYWVGRRHWGQGFATEAGEAMIAWAEGARRLKALAAGHFADNPASGRVLEKLGFLYTGEIKKRLSYARTTPVATRMMIRLS